MINKIVTPLLKRGITLREEKRWPSYNGSFLNRQNFVTASEVGSCERRIWYNKNSSPILGEFNGMAERGHTAEAWIVEQLKRVLGGDLQFAGDGQLSFTHEHLSGTPDGLILLGGDDAIVLEIKCIDPRTNWSKLPKPNHVDQVIQNIYILRNTFLNLNIDRGSIIYIDAADYGKTEEFIIDFDVAHFNKLYNKSKKIISSFKAEDLNPDGIYNGDCQWCDFKSICTGAVKQQERQAKTLSEIQEKAKNVFG